MTEFGSLAFPVKEKNAQAGNEYNGIGHNKESCYSYVPGWEQHDQELSEFS